MNKLPLPQIAKQIAAPLGAIASPQRLAILLAIGKGEACVCHLEAALGWRQAYISQHLMVLRKAGILQDRREGRYIFYRLANESVLDLVLDAARMSGIDALVVESFEDSERDGGCGCPHCTPEPALIKLDS
ncbi:MAG: ArsR/SmtB family transcription factor [Bacteroidota bacterium]